MGAPYTTTAISGYNSSAPADDGSTASSNQITWAKHKTKLGDPIKTAVESMNTKLATFADFSVRQITSSDSTVAGDHMRCVEVASTVSSTVSVTVSLGDAATMTNNYRVFVKNSRADASVTLGRVTVGDTIDGTAGNVTIPAKSGVIVQTNSSANGYLVLARTGDFPVGSVAPNTGSFTTLATSGNVTLGDSTADAHTINGAVTMNESASQAFLLDSGGATDTGFSARVNGNAAAGYLASTNNGANLWFMGARKDGVGGSSGTDRINFLYDSTVLAYISTAGAWAFANVGTTASAANAFLDSGSSPGNNLLRSTSSIRYKTDIQDVTAAEVDAAMTLRPITYKSKADADDKSKRWFGFLAEDAHDKQPMLVTYGKDEEGAALPDGFQYERMTVILLAKVKELEARLAALEA